MASSSNELPENYWNKIPPGYRFEPRDEELITHYLIKKINGEALPPNKMHDEVELYGDFSPEKLTPYYEPTSENNWYFFTQLERLHDKGNRPKRSAGNGYWKMTGKEIPITNKQGNNVIGFRRNFAFFTKIESSLPKQKDEPKGIKTPWLMHEFRVNNDTSTSEPKPKRRKTNDHDGTSQLSQGSKPKNMLDGLVLCKVYRLVKDVEVKALNSAHQQEQHLQYHQEYHQGVEHVQYDAPNDLFLPSNEDTFQFSLQRNVTVEATNSAHQEEQRLHYHQQHVALNGANDHLLIPEIEENSEHALPQYSPEQLEFLSFFNKC